MINWNSEADAKLLAIILDVHQIKVDYAAVAARFGEGCTPKAVTHRVANIKSRAKAVGDAATALPSTPNGKKTPSKAGTKRGKADATDDEENHSPTKKKARTPRSKASKKSYKEASEESEPAKSEGAAEDSVEMEGDFAVKGEDEDGEIYESAHEPAGEEP